MKKEIFTMKKLVALLRATAMMFTCVACGGNAEGGNTEENNEVKVEIADAEELLTKAWDEYKASTGEDLQFMIGGGNAETMVMDAPATFDPTIEYAEDALLMSYCIPVETVAKTDDIATMMNMMMSNNFTGAAYHVANAADVETVIGSIKETTLNNQWMCGMPEKLIIVTVGEDYVVSAYGIGAVVDAFEAALTTVYGDAVVVTVEENIAE